MKEERGERAGPFADLGAILRRAGMPTARFTALIGVPERTYRRWQAKDKAKGVVPPRGRGRPRLAIATALPWLTLRPSNRRGAIATCGRRPIELPSRWTD